MMQEKEVSSFETLLTPKDELDTILRTPLTPETADIYATTALERLVELVRSTVARYNRQPTIAYESLREQEEAAFRYYGLENIEAILDHVADKQDELSEIDAFIGNAKEIQQVILPSDELGRQERKDGTEKFIPKKHIPRLKTTLFVLKNEYGIAIDDLVQCTLTTGRLDKTMMRQESYFALHVIPLERTILVCDEAGNVTYVFNSKALQATGVDGNMLLAMTKSELNSFVASHPDVGQSLQYSQSFVPKIIELINDPAARVSDAYSRQVIQERSYLAPPTAEGYLSVHAMAPVMGVNFRTLRRVVNDLGEQLSGAIPFTHTRGISYKYSPKDQEIIRQYLSEKGYYAPPAPEDVLTIKAVAKRYSVANVSVLAALEQIGDEIGPTTPYRFGDVIADGYSLEQQEMIRRVLEARGLMVNMATDDIISLARAAGVLGISAQTIQKIIPHVEELGDIQRYKFGPRITDGYTTDQIERMRAYLQEQGYYTEAPEGYVAQSQLTKDLGVDHRHMKRAIEAIGDTFGNTLRARYNGMVTNCYSPEQQTRLRDFFAKKRAK